MNWILSSTKSQAKFLYNVISQGKTFTIPNCDIRGLPAGKNSGPITWGGEPQLWAAYEVLGLRDDYFLEYMPY